MAYIVSVFFEVYSRSTAVSVGVCLVVQYQTPVSSQVWCLVDCVAQW